MLTQENWKTRTDWEGYWSSKDQAHRNLVIKKLEGIKFDNVLEVGCACCPMLKRIGDKFNSKLYGIDISSKAIELGKEKLPEAELKVGDIMNIPYKKKFDLVITDAVLIYFDTSIIEQALRELKRVGKNFLFVELNNNQDGQHREYSYYDYKKLLKEIGFKNIKVDNYLREVWDNDPWNIYGSIITANA